MASEALRCFFPDCSGPVVGQCRGYGSHCGRFYCHQHSVDGRCSKCAEEMESSNRQFQEHQMIWGLIDKYTDLASTSPGATPFAAIFKAAFPALLLWMVIDLIHGPGIVVGIISFVVLFWVISKRSQQLERNWLESVAVTNPGFEEFYAVWKQDRNESERSALAQGFIASIGLAVATTIAMSAMAIEQNSASAQGAKIDRALDDIHQIRRNVDAI